MGANSLVAISSVVRATIVITEVLEGMDGIRTRGPR